MKVAIIIIIFLFIFYIVEYNRIKTLHNKVLQSKSAIDVYLNQRFDLIPNLVECVKGYAKHEQDVLDLIVKERNAYNKNKSLELAKKLNKSFNTIVALQESYPDLKASENFLKLQDELEKMESQLQAARRLYNSDVTMYNTKISTFPGNFVAGAIGVKEEELFEIEEYKKENIKVNM